MIRTTPFRATLLWPQFTIVFTVFLLILLAVMAFLVYGNS